MSPRDTSRLRSDIHADLYPFVERPCGRCLKRNIGHLCHDEPREVKKPKQNGVQTNDHEHDELAVSIPSAAPTPSIHSIASIIEPQAPQASAPQVKQTTQAPLAPPPIPLPRTSAPTIIAPLPVSATSRPTMDSNGQACKYTLNSYKKMQKHPPSALG